jgi:hypothetical protein
MKSLLQKIKILHKTCVQKGRVANTIMHLASSAFHPKALKILTEQAGLLAYRIFKAPSRSHEQWHCLL